MVIYQNTQQINLTFRVNNYRKGNYNTLENSNYRQSTLFEHNIIGIKNPTEHKK